MYPPKVVKRPRFSKLREIRQPFFDLDHEKWKPQILQRIVQNPLNSPTHTANHVKLAQFTLISKIPCSLSKTAIFTANYAKSAQFANPYSDSREIPNSHYFVITLLFLVLAFVRQDPHPACTNYANLTTLS